LGDRAKIKKKYDEMGDQHFKFLSSMHKSKNDAGLFKIASLNLYFTMFKEDLQKE
jgi:replication-associated recombination protein RarA